MFHSFLALLAVLATLAAQTQSQAVFAHVIVGNNAAYTPANWASDIALAAAKGIDAFALNIAPPLVGTVERQVAMAFSAAEASGTPFRLFFSFDYEGSGTPWDTADILTLLTQYAASEAYFRQEGRPFVSTFEGPGNSDVEQWSEIRASVKGGIYFVPAWTSRGPSFRQDLIDGAFSWNMWPDGARDMGTEADEAWMDALAGDGKSYMMGISPWFYTNLPAYEKAWVWRGDSMWYDRWQQALTLKPAFIELVTWNDYGESHYLRNPQHPSCVPHAPDADAQPYVTDFPHEAWLESLPYQIAAYKHAVAPSANPAPAVPHGEDKVIYWFRTSPASAGETEATGNCCPSAINTFGYQTCVPIAKVLQDKIFAIALLSRAAHAQGSVRISVGGAKAQESGKLKAGINFFSVPFDASMSGAMRITISRGGSGQGPEIRELPADGVANFNAWVGCVGSCSNMSV